MKLGMVAYPWPANLEMSRRLEWDVRNAADLGANMVGDWPWSSDVNHLRRIRDLADSLAVEIEPYVDGVFGLVGPTARESLEKLKTSIKLAKVIGGPYLHTGYGLLTVETSRFNRDIHIEKHLGKLIANLKEAAKVASDEGVVIVVENHSDFRGVQLAQVMAAVDSPAIRACPDTLNCLIVFSDPVDDLLALAPYIAIVHLHDARIVSPHEWYLTADKLPFMFECCAVGQGYLDVELTLRTLAEQSPRGLDTPLIIELWQATPGQAHELFPASFAWLRTSFAPYVSPRGGVTRELSP